MKNYLDLVKNIHFKTPVLPTKISMKTSGMYRRIDELAAKSQDTVIFAQAREYKNNFQTELRSKVGVLLAKHSFSMSHIKKTLHGGFMITFGKHRNKGLGEIMRLMSIIHLQKNNLSYIIIDSLPKAIKFHAKYKFQTKLKDNRDAVNVLNDIINITDENSETNIQARALLKKIQTFNFSIENDELFAKIVNTFIDNHISDTIKNNRETGIEQTLPMILTKEQISANSDFFNKLFIKHQINYRV